MSINSSRNITPIKVEMINARDSQVFFSNAVTRKNITQQIVEQSKKVVREQKLFMGSNPKKGRGYCYYNHAGYDIAHDDMVRYSLYPAMHKRYDRWYQKELSDEDLDAGMIFYLELDMPEEEPAPPAPPALEALEASEK